MATYQSFSFSVEEYAEEMTAQTHRTIDWMLNNGYIDNETWDILTGTLVVTPISNKKGWGKKILQRFFGKKDPDGQTFVFPIVQLEEWYMGPTDNPEPKGKPNLSVVKNINQPKEEK